MNPHPFRSLRPIPATHSDARLTPVTGRVEAHALAGHLVTSLPSAQPNVPSEAPSNEPIRMLRLAQVATITGLSKAKVSTVIQFSPPAVIENSPSQKFPQGRFS